ncbi:chromosome condensation regulator RCC1 [Gracilaria domingensis]|nr:chromosome condensation regulator RCC1 [Gracilaria domingensis]
MSASVPAQSAPEDSQQQVPAAARDEPDEAAKKQPMSVDQPARETQQPKQNGAQHNHQPLESNAQSEPEPQPKPPTKHTSLLFCGSTKWDLMGRKSIPKAVEKRGGSDAGQEYLAPQRLQFSAFEHKSFSAVYSGSSSAHLVLLDEDGIAYGLGRNDCAQLGFSDLVSRKSLQQFELPLKENEHIVHAACGRSHTLLVSSLGRVFAAGANSHGQLGIGSRSVVTGWEVASIPNGMRVTQVSAGSEFSMFLCDGGDVYAAGNGEHGHLGNGRTGERIESAGKVVFDAVSTPSRVLLPQGVKIQQIASGSNHTLALDEKGKVWSWGWGGYGRLGHRQPKDELTPRMITTFDGDHYKLDFVAAGSTCSFAVQKSRHSIFFWGVTKKSGESFMYPKPLFDLQGWLVRSVAAGVTSVVVSAERSVISWGPSPTYGELGYGNGPKSSTKPKKMDVLEGLEVKMVAMGIGFTAMIAEYTDEEEAIIKELGEVIIEGEAPQEQEKDEAKGKRKAPVNPKKKKKRRR